MKKFIALLTVLVIIFTLAGCQSKTYQDILLDIDSYILSLDPQFATDESSRFVIYNCFVGLVKLNDAGDVTAAIAEKYTVTSDGLTYVFSLRKDAEWSDGTKITANDFYYTFMRMFDPVTPSPFAATYADVKNSEAIMAGTLPMSELGVKVINDQTLQIQLTAPNSNFLKLLCDTPAMPCPPAFFTETMARYGKDVDHTLFNGAYRVTYWNNEYYVRLVKNASFYDQKKVNTPSVYIFSRRGYDQDGIYSNDLLLKYFLDGNSDIYMARQSDLDILQAAGYQIDTVNNISWLLTTNQNNPLLANDKIRKSLLQVLDTTAFPEQLASFYHPTTTLMPDAYQSLPRTTDEVIAQAAATFRQGLAEQELDSLTGVTIIYPKSAEFDNLASYMIRQWKDHFITYVNFVALDDADYKKRLQSGDFTLALTRLEYENNSLESLYTPFTTGDFQNYYGYQSDQYDQLVAQASEQLTNENKQRFLLQAEALLKQDGIAIPIAGAHSYYAFALGINAVSVNNFVDLTKIFKEVV